MPKRGRRSDRDEALGADPGGLGGDEDYDWIKYLGEGRSTASSSPASSASASTALQAPPRTIIAPPERPTARPERPTARPERPVARPRRTGPETGLTADGDTDPGAGGAFGGGSGRGAGRSGAGRSGAGRRAAGRRSEPADSPDDSFADYLGPAGRPGRSAHGSDPYARPATSGGRGATAEETARFAAQGDDWAEGGMAAPAAGLRPARPPPTSPAVSAAAAAATVPDQPLTTAALRATAKARSAPQLAPAGPSPAADPTRADGLVPASRLAIPWWSAVLAGPGHAARSRSARARRPTCCSTRPPRTTTSRSTRPPRTPRSPIRPRAPKGH